MRRDIPTRCPGCDKEAVYSFDRFYHVDGTDNKPCWLKLLRGQVGAGDPFEQGVALEMNRLAIKAEAQQRYDAEQTQPTEHNRYQSGGSLLDLSEGVPAVWGAGSDVLWAAGQPFWLVAPAGVGKTTLVGQLVRSLIGVGTDVLGWPVKETWPVLYVAGDRPAQIERSLRRNFGPEDREKLDERLVIWHGPPPGDMAKDPELLMRMCDDRGAGAVILDSAKDMAIGLTDDAVGAGFNRALQIATAEGVEVCAQHHQRKGRDGLQPKKLEDVYGSTWLTAGAGSVVLLWGLAGDLVVELSHLKPAVEQVGPLKIEHDHSAGTSRVYRGFDALAFLRNRGTTGATATDAAKAWFEKSKPTDSERLKAKRRLDGLVKEGLAIVSSASLGGDGGSQGATYKATDGAPTLK